MDKISAWGFQKLNCVPRPISSFPLSALICKKVFKLKMKKDFNENPKRQ